jgi:hypothetical protein
MDSQTEHVTKTQLGQICSIECSVLAFLGVLSLPLLPGSLTVQLEA